MAGLNGLLGIARDAMVAQSFGLSVTGQNVSNVNTPGYVRREAMLETLGVPGASAGGVRARGTMRNADELVERRWYQANAFANASRQQDTALAQVEAMLNDSAGAGLRSDIQALFTSFSALSASPNDTAARAVVLSKADTLARRFNQTATGLSDLREDLAGRAKSMADQVNGLTARIASLNRDIITAESGGDVAADLRDQQGELVRELSEIVEVNVLSNSDGMIVLSAGVALVDGKNHASLNVEVTASGSMEIQAVRPSGAAVDMTGKLDGGALAGVLHARDVDIVSVIESLDTLAFDLASAVNGQHSVGVGLDGVGGRDLFSVTAPPGTAYAISLDVAVAGNPDAVAAADGVASLPGGSDNAVLLAKLGDALVAQGGTRTLVEAYGDIVGRVASTRAAATREADVRGAMQEQIHALRDSVSGVSLDEEMVSLTRYQRAYEAATKLVSTVDELLGELIRQV